jgi:DNA-binding MarR family transcriptional regulator
MSMRLDDQLCFALYSAAQSIQRLYRPLLDSLDLTYPQYLVLLVLWEDDELSVSEIGDRLSLNSATLTPLLKRMEGAGLVARHRSAEDGRKVTVSLLPKGAKLQAKVSKITTDVTCAAIDATPDAAGLRDTLHQLRQELPDTL